MRILPFFNKNVNDTSGAAHVSSVRMWHTLSWNTPSRVISCTKNILGGPIIILDIMAHADYIVCGTGGQNDHIQTY
jgi:hypothetical protein